MTKKKLITGLPEELDTFETIAKEQKIKVRVEKRSYGKMVTLIEGIDDTTIDVKNILKELKRRLGCGGTYDKENKVIELQGDHRSRIKKVLEELGFTNVEIETT